MMLRKTISVTLMTLLLICCTVPAAVVSAEAPDAEPALVNADLENDIWGEAGYGWDKAVSSWGQDGNVTLKWSEDTAHSGSHSLNYYSAIENRMDISQSLTLPAGDYEFSGYAMGEGSAPVFYCDAASDSAEVQLGGWQNWKEGCVTFTLKETTAVKVGVSVELQAGDWGYLDSFALNVQGTHSDERRPSEKVDIEPVRGLSDDFMLGADISSLLSLEKAGVKFYDSEGRQADLFAILDSAGVNWIRVRIWNDPFDADGNGYGGGNNDLAAALELGERAAEHGMQLYLDFHYSDFWAYPNVQTLPKAWKTHSAAELRDDIYSFTFDSLKAFEARGIPVDMVQIGNEISGKFCEQEGNWDSICSLLNAGCTAVRDFDPSVRRMIHFGGSHVGKYLNYMAILKSHNVDYDVAGLSWYAFYLHGTIENLGKYMNEAASTYGKEIVLAENSYPSVIDDSDGHPETFGDRQYFTAPYSESMKPWEISPQGQAEEVRDAIETVSSVSGGLGAGYFYWEPAWITVGDTSALSGDAWEKQFAANRELWNRFGCGWASKYAASYSEKASQYWGGSSWDNQAMFAPDGQAYDAVNVFRYVRTGSSAPHVTVTESEQPFTALRMSSGLSEADIWKAIWKNSVQCTLSDGSKRSVPVLRWVDDDCRKLISAYSAGKVRDYVINGILNGYGHAAVTMKVRIVGDAGCIRSAALGKSSFICNGKVKTPAVTVISTSGTTLVRGTDYTVTYPSGRKAVGKYVVTVRGCGKYEFTKKLTFRINPGATSIVRLSSGSRRMTVTVKKRTTGTTGYQIRYSRNKKFTSAKSAWIKNSKTTRRTIRGLKRGTRYYVKVRTYKTIDGRKHYSAWSVRKSIQLP